MSGVDVLAVIDREISRWDGIESYSDGKDLIAVRAAVAELIEAASAGSHMIADGGGVTIYFGVRKATQLMNALARVGGAK